jgi:ABC-type amino acid transport substrate-binding protein
MHIIRRSAAVILMLAGLFVSSLEAQQAPVLGRVLQTDTLRVGMSGNQPLFNAHARTGELIGIDVDLARLIAAAMEVELQIVTRPFGELLPALTAGEVDMVISGMAITAERSRETLFVGPYMVSGKSILTNSRALAAAQQATEIDQPELKLAALQGSTSQRFVERYVPRAQLVTVDDYDAAVQMVIADDVDAMVADMPVCIVTMLRYPNQGLATLTEPLTLEPIGIAVPASDMHFRVLIDNYIDALEGLGVLEELRQRWTQDASWVAALR